MNPGNPRTVVGIGKDHFRNDPRVLARARCLVASADLPLRDHDVGGHVSSTVPLLVLDPTHVIAAEGTIADDLEVQGFGIKR